MAKNSKLLKTLIEEEVEHSLLLLLSEDDDGGGDYGGESSLGGIYGDYYNSLGYMDHYGGGGHGGHHGSGTGDGNGVLDAFGLGAITDIFKTGMWAGKTLTSQATSAIKQIVLSLLDIAVPFYEIKFEELKEEELRELAQIKNQYAEVLERNEKFMRDHDMWGIAFVLDPQLMLGAKVIQNSPQLARELTGLLGVPNLIPKAIQWKKKPKWHHFESTTTQNDGANVLTEDQDQQPQWEKNKKATEPVSLTNAPSVVQFRQSFLKKVLEEVQRIKQAKSVEELVPRHSPSSIKPNMKRVALVGLKQGIISHIVSWLESIAKTAPNIANEIHGVINNIKQ